MNKVLVLAVHPDDETFGCGGTLLKHKMNGDEIYWLIATSMTRRQGFTGKQLLKEDCKIKKVSKMYNFDGIHQLKIPVTKVDKTPQKILRDKILDVFNKIKPNVIYLPFKGDVHSDHRIIFETAYSCTKIFRSSFVKKVLMMETISETEFAPSLKEYTFIPNYFVDISKSFDKKLEIIKVYKEELSGHPFPRSVKHIEALAIHRGAMSGCNYAEGFMLLKEMQ